MAEGNKMLNMRKGQWKLENKVIEKQVGVKFSSKIFQKNFHFMGINVLYQCNVLSDKLSAAVHMPKVFLIQNFD